MAFSLVDGVKETLVNEPGGRRQRLGQKPVLLNGRKYCSRGLDRA